MPTLARVIIWCSPRAKRGVVMGVVGETSTGGTGTTSGGPEVVRLGVESSVAPEVSKSSHGSGVAQVSLVVAQRGPGPPASDDRESGLIYYGRGTGPCGPEDAVDRAPAGGRSRLGLVGEVGPTGGPWAPDPEISAVSPAGVAVGCRISARRRDD
ncbi:hypothetical protein GUJ93_ZPchr0013g37577 [Zizania palustris]|uniref:Uncharacterized protein n=1 Tax=Zizania palustris TaxID=103762 RepID=A0A8J5X292_ZIZPA|nr:hypothetical protein GUJ93_ZPchr0013g37577 [Zizania palustris]